ncbi:hypothetical protein EVAR_34534_1 [Eumeta japonica]|uniref:Uncharacterized protein n=1 Tax=Eumeta variegata TaxID=151549 RepID=A0A4C1X6L0_EUMVA|nr:hypothetical protein EVAR_34534_1 [Eumeta japonica]
MANPFVSNNNKILLLSNSFDATEASAARTSAESDGTECTRGRPLTGSSSRPPPAKFRQVGRTYKREGATCSKHPTYRYYTGFRVVACVETYF